MKLNETTLSFLEVDSIQQFGKEKGKLIFEQAEKIFQELLNNADYLNNAAIQNHLQAKLFPALSCSMPLHLPCTFIVGKTPYIVYQTAFTSLIMCVKIL